MTSSHRGWEESAARSLSTYREHLYLEGHCRRESVGSDGRLGRGALKAEEVERVLRSKGRLPIAEYLRCRMRCFCDGAVLGSREQVEGIFRAYRKRIGPKRKTGAQAMRGLGDRALFTLRDLQRRVFGRPAA